MFVDAVDSQGRRYCEVLPHVLSRAHVVGETADHECIDCGRLIRHGRDRYFQRNDLGDGTQADRLAALLLALTYDAVCGDCGDRQILAGAT